MAVLGAVGAVSILSLSDRAPSMLVATARALIGGLIPAGATSLLAGLVRAIPVAPDVVGHAVVWAVISLLACGLVRSSIARLNLAIGLVALSAVIEVGQQVATWSRSASLSDLVGNAVGVTAGFVLFTVIERVFGRDRGELAAPRTAS
jgi:small-conductance mechanosensitive channel